MKPIKKIIIWKNPGYPKNSIRPRVCAQIQREGTTERTTITIHNRAELYCLIDEIVPEGSK